MRCVKVTDSTTVTHNEIFETPFVAKNLLEQTVTAAAGVIVESLIGTHHLSDLSILYQRLEGWHVGLPEVAYGNVCEVGGMAGVFRTTMYGIVLGTGPEFAILGILRPLQSTYHLGAHYTCQVGIFTVSLLSTSPTRVTEDVDIRSPYRQAAHLHIFTSQVIHTMVVLCSHLRTGGIEHLI